MTDSLPSPAVTNGKITLSPRVREMITKQIANAAALGAQSLRSDADRLEKTPEFKGDNSAGRILRTQRETYLETADLLEGWAKRHGWSEDE